MPTKQSFSVGDVAKVHIGRGRDGLVQITRLIETSSMEAEFVYLDNKKEKGRLYTAHLYKDIETMRKTQQLREERAAKIGTRR